MAVVTNPTLLAVASWSSWQGANANEQDLDEVNGDRFPNVRGTILYARNTTVAAIELDFYADVLGTEVLVGSVSVAGSGTAHGVRFVGPFPSDVFNVHDGTVAAANGHVVLKQASGAAGDVVVSPFAPPQGLAR